MQWYAGFGFFFNLIMQVKYAACDKSDVFKLSKKFDNQLEMQT